MPFHEPRRVAARIAFALSMPALASILATSMPAAVVADTTINPGYDLFRSLPGTYVDFSVEPVPAGFFGPGSLPFESTVDLADQATSYPNCPADPLTDTIFMRPIASTPPDAIPFYLAQLSLVSVSPIVVHYASGPDQLWNMRVELAPVPVPPGTMTIRHEVPDGGTFDLQIGAYPQFVFTSVAGGPVLVHHPLWPVAFSASQVPWRFDVPPAGSCRSNFCVNPVGQTVLTNRFGRNVVAAVCSSSAVSAGDGEATSTWGRVKTRYR